MSSSTSYSSETSSDRSHHDEPYDPVCTYRTPQFHDLECSRYFDCPTHTIERARSETAAEDDDQDDDQDEGLDANEEDEDDDDDDEDQHNDDDEDDEEDEDEELFQEESQGGGDEHEELSLQPGEVSPLSEEGPLDRQSGKSPERGRTLESHSGGQHDIIDLTTPSPGPRQEASPIAGPSNRAGYASVVVDLTSDSPPQSVGRDAAETSGEERALPNIPMTDVGLDSPVQRVGEAELLSAQRRPATPPSPPPPIRRRTSSNNFDNPPRSTQPQLQRSSAGRRPSDIVLPRWQPDAEVTICPICHTQFSIFVRKHHCRKCGRVVCAGCSPHRITIPYQYIVVPPGAPRPGLQRYPSSLISGEGGYADFSSLGGGERVRLCNPCVPDPNTNPPQSQDSPTSIRGHGRSQSNVGSISAYGPNIPSSNRSLSYYTGRADDTFGRNRSATMLPSGSRAPSGSHSYQSTHNRILSGTPPSHYPYAIPSSSSYRRTHMHRPGLEVGQASSSSAAAAHRRPLPPDPPQLAEEDECPVCHRELPPRELPNYESLREAHINICITSHSTYGGTPSAEGSSRPRRTGMFPYLATEKDCVDSAECTICLEEFEVGVPMARLECLCRFHRDCISRWFAKNPGRCPVHSHDGHGF